MKKINVEGKKHVEIDNNIENVKNVEGQTKT